MALDQKVTIQKTDANFFRHGHPFFFSGYLGGAARACIRMTMPLTAGGILVRAAPTAYSGFRMP